MNRRVVNREEVHPSIRKEYPDHVICPHCKNEIKIKGKNDLNEYEIEKSFYNEKPAVAKNTKQIIFGTEYENVFSEDITADSILLVNEIFNLSKL